MVHRPEEIRAPATTTMMMMMMTIEVVCNDQLGKKVRVKCDAQDTIRDLKKLIAAQTGTHWKKIVLKKRYMVFKDHVSLADYEIHDGMSLELYYQKRGLLHRVPPCLLLPPSFDTGIDAHF